LDLYLHWYCVCGVNPGTCSASQIWHGTSENGFDPLLDVGRIGGIPWGIVWHCILPPFFLLQAIRVNYKSPKSADTKLIPALSTRMRCQLNGDQILTINQSIHVAFSLTEWMCKNASIACQQLLGCFYRKNDARTVYLCRLTLKWVFQ
jgi:hypothetical protein